MIHPCNKDIFTNGVCVFVTHTIAAADVERFVQAVAILSEQPVDWHYYGGRACVLTIGDIKEVEKTIISLLPIHNRMYDKAMKELNLTVEDCDYPRHFPQREKTKKHDLS